MPLVVGQLATIAGGVLMTMLGQLMTASFMRAMTVKGLEILVKRTKTEEDDKILLEAKKAWNYE